jgi:transposase
MWSLIGQQPVVPSAGQDARIAVFGSLNPVTGRLVANTAAKKNSGAFIAHLKALLQASPGKHVFLFIDNSPIHHSKTTQRFLADQASNLTVIWNAAYTPELNLIERYWGHLKPKAIHNYFFESAERLEQAVLDAIRDLNRAKELRMIVHLDFVHSLRKAA